MDILVENSMNDKILKYNQFIRENVNSITFSDGEFITLINVVNSLILCFDEESVKLDETTGVISIKSISVLNPKLYSILNMRLRFYKYPNYRDIPIDDAYRLYASNLMEAESIEYINNNCVVFTNSIITGIETKISTYKQISTNEPSIIYSESEYGMPSYFKKYHITLEDKLAKIIYNFCINWNIEIDKENMNI